jgi:hypothetical protein
MHRFFPISLRAVCFLLALIGANVPAVQRGSSPAGVAYASGGIGQDEQQALHAQRREYSFWLTTAVRRSGAHLAGVLVRIREADSGRLVLDHRMDGPWLFAQLPVGRYEVEATLQNLSLGRIEVQRGSTAIHPGDHHQMLLYFETGEAIGEREPGSAAPNRYDGEKPAAGK